MVYESRAGVELSSMSHAFLETSHELLLQSGLCKNRKNLFTLFTVMFLVLLKLAGKAELSFFFFLWTTFTDAQ